MDTAIKDVSWFLERVGLKIYAHSRKGFNGQMAITDEHHARYLHFSQNQLSYTYEDIEQADKPAPPSLIKDDDFYEFE